MKLNIDSSIKLFDSVYKPFSGLRHFYVSHLVELNNHLFIVLFVGVSEVQLSVVN